MHPPPRRTAKIAGCVALLVALLSAPAPALAAASLETCLANPATADCASLDYTAATTQLVSLCNASPYLSACTVYKVCQVQSSALGTWCDPFTLLSSACGDVSKIASSPAAQCTDITKLCAAGSVVAKCTNASASTLASQGFINTTQAQTLINSMCNDMDMAGCTNCTTTDNTVKSSCETLTVLSDMCRTMASMNQCRAWSSMCKTSPNSCFCRPTGSCIALIGVNAQISNGSSPPSSPSSSPATAAPSSTSSGATTTDADADWSAVPAMLMYFHVGIADYFLFRSWVPRNALQYTGSLVAVFLLGFFFEGAVVGRGIMEQSWTAAEDKRIRSGEPYILEGLKVDGQRFIVTVVTVGLGYCVMLLTMTFNVGVFFMCIIGIGAGSVVFRKFKPMTLVLDEVDETKECC